MQINSTIKDVIIWTQPNCSACDTAKKLLEQLNIPYMAKTIDSVETKQLFFTSFPGARSVPQISVAGEWIGGLQELKRLINDNSKALKMV